MPAKPLMSWNKSQRRWEKMHRGRRVWVTCADLGLPADKWTKEDSYQAANGWWETRLAELTADTAANHPHADRLDELTARHQYATSHGLPEDAAELGKEIKRVKAAPADPDAVADIDPDTARRLAGLRALGYDVPNDPVVQRLLSPSEAVWADRLQRAGDTPADRTLGALADRWLADRQDEARKGVRSAENADALKRAVSHFRAFAGPAADVDTVTADLWHRWYVRCAAAVAERDRDDGEGWSADTAAKYFGVSRAFVKWLWERDLLDKLPKNLTNKQHRFERPEKNPPTFTDAEVKTLLGAARGVHRLIALLMLNTGATQKDVADLTKKQIDLTAGRITRRRSKMQRKKASRTVSYKLWPEVVELLREHMNTNPAEPRALTTKSGQPWVWTETTTEGKLRKSDNVATIFNQLKKRAGLTGADKALKVFRKTSATKIKSNPEFKDLRHLFLGHSAKTVADRHYSGDAVDVLDLATDWLRTQYDLPGSVPVPPVS